MHMFNLKQSQLYFFLEEFQVIHSISLYFFLNHTFLKYVMVSHYMHMCMLTQ